MASQKKDQILTAARSVFLRYGFKRVSMADIAEAAGVSRPALYLLFKNKEEIFVGVFLDWVDETVGKIIAEMSNVTTVTAKLERAFEIWYVQPFELVTTSPGAHELIECTVDFARATQSEGYARFEETITPVLVPFAQLLPDNVPMSVEKIAHLLASAVQGFKQSANSTSELRTMIKGLLDLALSEGRARQTVA